MHYWYLDLLSVLAYAPILLGVASAPLAARGAGPVVWRIHTGVALLLGLFPAGVFYVLIFGAMLPWWQVGIGAFASSVAPVLAAGWGARVAVRIWPPRRWIAAWIATVAMFVAVGAVGYLIGRATLPVVINTVQ